MTETNNKPELEKMSNPYGISSYQMKGFSYSQERINLLDYWRVLISYRMTILSVTSLITLIVILLAFLTVPIYRSEILLAPAQEEESASGTLAQLGGLASMVGVNIGGGNSTEESIAVLKSKAFLDRFIEDKKLLPVLFADMWDVIVGQWKVNNPKDIPTARDAYELFIKDILRINIAKDSGLVTVSIEWNDPELTADWANELIQRLNSHLRQVAIDEGQKSIDYLEKQLNKTSVVEMQQTLYRLIESETQKMMIANVRQEYAFKVLDPAVVPERKIKPKRTLMAVFGVVSGLMIGLFSAFLRQYIKDIRNGC